MAFVCLATKGCQYHEHWTLGKKIFDQQEKLMSIGVSPCIAKEYIHTCVSNTKQKQDMYIYTLCMSLLWESSSSHRAGFTRLKITTSWSFLTITCSENHIRRFWLSWPALPNESSITTSSQHWYTESLHNEKSAPVQRYIVKKLLHRTCDKGLWKP